MSNFKNKLLEVLKQDERVWNDGELNSLKLKDFADKCDEKFIEILLNNEETRDRFFMKIKDVYVFKLNDFKFFLDENKLDNSYTSFANQIGLYNGSKLLRNTGDVVLNWPFKDCILEGGQSSEEGTDTFFEFDEKSGDFEEKEAKRKEIFFNEVLARDEIDRLEEKKALKNFKRFTEKGEEEVGEFKRDENGTIKENLIIKGNNLLALHSLKKEFAGKVKLIYIDPPYNTGTDSFKYNDNFNHSTWLTFMKNRLEVAKEFLRDDGVIFVQCDDNEQAYLKVLMDDIYGVDKFINIISVKMNESKGLKNAHIEKRMPKNKEYLLIFGKNKDTFLYNPEKIDKEKDELLGYVKYYNKFIPNINDDINLWKIEKYEKGNIYEEKIKDKDNLIYMVKPDNDIKYDKLIKNKFFKITNSKGKDNIFYYNGSDILKVLFLGENTSKFLGDLWLDISTININKESGVKTLSNGQKPEKLIQRIINLATNQGDIVLDYHLGSGTTAAVAHKMGRQYIGIEQMDYIEDISCERLKKVIDGEQGGISKIVDWKGGGDFVYFELAKWNEEAKEKINECESLEELVKFFDKMYEKYFLNYNLKIKEFKEELLVDEKFKNLTLDKQKYIFLKMLDLNQMYVNFDERNDKKYGLSAEDIKLSEDFYNENK